MSRVRTRYAPSPTGRMYVRNSRTALHVYLIAKHEGGDFPFRIEGTDQERYVEGVVEITYQTLKDTGLIHDEGSDEDGGVGPYVQSEHQASGIYPEYARKLVDKREAYYCFCTPECLSSPKKTVNGEEIMVYDKHRLGLSREEVEANPAAGMPYVIRQSNPVTGAATFKDEIYGGITMDNPELDDTALIKSDGYPTYNLANMVDDHLMGIIHVMRGNECLSSSPKHNRPYEAFGWEVPVCVYCPLIMDEEYHKLSKRSGHSSFEDLLKQRFTSGAVVNYVAFLGWPSEDNHEIFSLEEMVKEFGYRCMSRSSAVFNMTRPRWMNSGYVKAMDSEQFFQMAEPYIRAVIKKDLDLRKIASMVKTGTGVFLEIAGYTGFFGELPKHNAAMYTHKKMKTNSETAPKVLTDLLPVLEGQKDYSNDALYLVLSGYVEETGVKTGLVMWPIRTTVSGKQMILAGATEIMEVFGKEEFLVRLKKGIGKLREQVNGGIDRS